MRERPVPRWATLTGVFSIPFLALVITSAIIKLPVSADIESILKRANIIKWGASSLEWAPKTFAPLMPAFTSATGGWAWAPVLLTGVVFSGFLAAVVRSARLLGWSVGATAATVLVFAGAPALTSALIKPSQTLTVALLVSSLMSAAVYTRRGSLLSFWASGLVLSLVVFTTPNAWVGVLAAIMGAAWMIQIRFPKLKWAAVGALNVIAFPPVIATLFWIYVAWWFTPDAGKAAALMLPKAGILNTGMLVGALAAMPVLLYAVVRNWKRALIPSILMLLSVPWVAPDAGSAFLLMSGVGAALMLAGPTPTPKVLAWLGIAQALLGNIVVILLTF